MISVRESAQLRAYATHAEGKALEYPFVLALQGAGGGVVCHSPLRVLPGRRLVCHAEWVGRAVIAKLFVHLGKAARDCARETRGLKDLAARGIPAPELLYSGPLADALGYVVLTRAIDAAETVSAVWQRAEHDAVRRHLLKQVMRVCARLHNAGLLHDDPHPDNFLCVDGRVYVLDGAGLRAPGTLSARQALPNLAQLCACLPPNTEAQIAACFGHYMNARQPPSQARDPAWWVSAMRRARHRNIERHAGRKALRAATAFRVSRVPGRFTVLARSHATPELDALLQCPEAAFGATDAHVLKQGRSATVMHLTMGGHQFVLKRYCDKDRWRAVRRALRPSRARRAWVNAHRLLGHGIASPEPVALIEERRGLFERVTWLCTAYMPGRSAREYFLDPAVSWDQKRASAARVCALIAALKQARIYHGDLKASNILITVEGPVLIDLDAMRAVTTCRLDTLHARDRARWLANWRDHPALLQLFTEVLLEPHKSLSEIDIRARKSVERD